MRTTRLQLVHSRPIRPTSSGSVHNQPLASGVDRQPTSEALQHGQQAPAAAAVHREVGERSLLRFSWLLLPPAAAVAGRARW